MKSRREGKKKNAPFRKIYPGMDREEGGQEGGASVAVTGWAKRKGTKPPPRMLVPEFKGDHEKQGSPGTGGKVWDGKVGVLFFFFFSLFLKRGVYKQTKKKKNPKNNLLPWAACQARGINLKVPAK